jgi:predicted transcriptional regulator
MMLVKDIIHPPISIDKDSIMTKALELMEKNKVTHIIVTDDNRVMGTLSDFNIADRLGSIKLGSIPTSSIHVSSLMESVNIFVNKEDSVIDVADKMIREKKSVFPVGSPDNFEGYITMHNFAKVCRQIPNKKIEKLYNTTSSTVESNERVVNVRNKLIKDNLPTAVVMDDDIVTGIIDWKLIGKAFASFRDVVPSKYHGARIRNLIVYDIKMRDPPTLKSTSTLSEAAEIFENKIVYGIPVIKNEKLMGVLYINNIVHWVQNYYNR